MTHQVYIPENMWKWAAEECVSSGEGPASYLRNILIGAMVQSARSNNNHAQTTAATPSAPETATTPKTPPTRPPEQAWGEKGKGVHQECWKDMVEEFYQRYPDADEYPFSSPMPAAKLVTICPHCLNQIKVGDPIMITTMKNWGLE